MCTSQCCVDCDVSCSEKQREGEGNKTSSQNKKSLATFFTKEFWKEASVTAMMTVRQPLPSIAFIICLLHHTAEDHCQQTPTVYSALNFLLAHFSGHPHIFVPCVCLLESLKLYSLDYINEFHVHKTASATELSFPSALFHLCSCNPTTIEVCTRRKKEENGFWLGSDIAFWLHLLGYTLDIP